MRQKTPKNDGKKDKKRRKYSKPQLTKHGKLSQTAHAHSQSY